MTTTPAAPHPSTARGIANKIGERFDRIDAHRVNARCCTNCQHCRVRPSDERDERGLPYTECSKGYWGEGVLVSLFYHAGGRAKEFAHRGDCNGFEDSGGGIA